MQIVLTLTRSSFGSLFRHLTYTSEKNACKSCHKATRVIDRYKYAVSQILLP